MSIWIWIGLIGVSYLLGVTFVVAMCTVSKQSRSDLPGVEREPDAEPIAVATGTDDRKEYAAEKSRQLA